MLQSQHSKAIQEAQKEMSQQVTKLQEQIAKRDAEKQQLLSQGITQNAQLN